ncbi:MAG: hypothetical protein KGH68_02635 [Patescibacteria group bacterium]|nr:hypothetical protein [Patescibacteria group bacterium]
MTQSTSSSRVGALLDDAKAQGFVSKHSLSVLQDEDIGDQIAAGLGTPALKVAASEVVLVSSLIDDSGSIRFVQGNAEAVREGHNTVLEALGGTKASEGIQAACRYLNGTILYDYRPLAGAVKMDASNFNPNGGTPLYDQAVVFLGGVLLKAQEFAQNGVPVRSVSLIVTDGNDEGSIKNTARDVAAIARDLLNQENHVIAFMGIDDGSTDFRQIARDMGIPAEWVLTPKNSPHEIRKAFALASKSAVRVSQATNFSQAAAGGFGG